MAILQFKNISLSFGENALFDKADFSIAEKSKIAVIGRNGVGKSTLFKMILGEIEPDNGTIESKAHHIAELPQVIPDNLSGKVCDFIAEPLDGNYADWQHKHKIDQILEQVQLDGSLDLSTLSGGQIRRCLLAQALISNPDILLLDEPTNHLDIPAIVWLEKFLQQCQITLLIITHDREFLQNVADSICEIDRGKVVVWQGNYDRFVVFKEQQLHAEEKANELFDKNLAAEEVWIRQGIKARRTRNEGRVRALKALRQERQQRREKQGTMSIKQISAERSGKIIFEIDKLTLEFQNKTLVKNFSSLVGRRDRIALIGPNGCGKTTLIRCLLGEIPPQLGTIKTGTQLKVAYFDQHRNQLDPTKSVIDNVAGGSQRITIGDQSKHIISYLQDFLFSPQRSQAPVAKLSGGERNRVLLAKLFTQASNLLIFDEPTNDLDMESIELLEEYLVNYQGTVLCASHDRSFINNIVTQSWYFQPSGEIIETVGGYNDKFLDYQAAHTTTRSSEKKPTQTDNLQHVNTCKEKITNHERRELSQLPDKIERWEKQIADIHQEMAQPGFYDDNNKSQSHRKVLQNKLEKLQAQCQQGYDRWQELLEKDS